ncbi:sigma-70 family RNA polymerase sigma factor [Bacillus mangrovi]|uniref:RNA polymerase sigma factor n=1 Tax=Metabacillus mangrovi TaxID=1491830 RepID=A0A7X2S975_9BACI|nr:RNA polymerase sigma factor [Metabacillus mangrovi]MTH55540.1 sigma-70 family RNA polymerase sigma factor [Metabacillus mangrovi]
MEEDELIKRARQGSATAFQQLVEIYRPVVERFAFQLGNRASDIDDITQEVFIRVYRFLDQFSKSKFSTWLYKITLNVTRDAGRKRTSSIKKVLKLQSEQNDPYPAAEAIALKNEKDRVLHICLQKLDSKYKIPIILFYFHEKKYDEIAEITSLTLSAVKTRILRGKGLLKKALEEYEKKEGETHG